MGSYLVTTELYGSRRSLNASGPLEISYLIQNRGKKQKSKNKKKIWIFPYIIYNSRYTALAAYMLRSSITFAVLVCNTLAIILYIEFSSDIGL